MGSAFKFPEYAEKFPEYFEPFVVPFPEYIDPIDNMANLEVPNSPVNKLVKDVVATLTSKFVTQ